MSIHFDPLIAKIITHGPDRRAAVNAMAEALDSAAVEGLNHCQPFLAALMDHPRWRRGDLSTAFIDEEYPDGFHGVAPDADLTVRLAMVALSVELARLRTLAGLPSRIDRGRPAQAEWVVAIGKETVAMKAVGIRHQSDFEIDLLPSGRNKPVVIVTNWRPGEPVWVGTIDGSGIVVQLRPVTAGIRLMWRGVDVVARVMTLHMAALAALMPEKKASGSAKLLRCPVPGLVVAINVTIGQPVRAGEAVAVVEAMKMENVLRAERDGVVKKIDAGPGDILAVDAVIVEFE